MNKIMELISLLKQEINWIMELNTLLSEEKQLLATSELDSLEELANKKHVLSNYLESSAKHRLSLIGHDLSSQSPVQSSLHEFLKNCSTTDANTVNALNNELFEQLTLCRELNTVNGQVIATNIYTRQQIVNELTGNKTEALSVYTSNGNLHSSPNDTSHHQKA